MGNKSLFLSNKGQVVCSALLIHLFRYSEELTSIESCQLCVLWNLFNTDITDIKIKEVELFHMKLIWTV